MQSKVHPTYKTKYRVANWAAYNKALVRRGDVTVWLSSDAIAAWTPGRSGRRGGQRRYSDLAIETALTLRLLYHLPLRQAEGFLHALFGMMRLDLSAPDYTTLSRRSQHLQRRLRPIPTGDGLHLVLDSTGLSIVGEGEWAAAKHGGRGRRGWRKIHLGVDRSGVIRVHTLTEATGDDATTALDLLTAVEGPLVRVTADAAYDTVAVYETALLHEDRFVQQRFVSAWPLAPRRGDRGRHPGASCGPVTIRATTPRVVEGPHAVDLRWRPHGGPGRAEQCPLGLPLPGLGPAPSGGLTTNSRRTGSAKMEIPIKIPGHRKNQPSATPTNR